MSKKPSHTTHAASAEPQITQEPSTLPRVRDAQGRELDQWGLPMNARARAAALEVADRREPREFPQDWEHEDRTGYVDGAPVFPDDPEKDESLTEATNVSSVAILTEKD